MRRLLTRTILSILLAAATAAAARAQGSQQQDDPPPPLAAAPKEATPFGRSRVEGGVFSNDFFGISFSLPKGWLVLNADDNKKILDTGKELVGQGASETKKNLMESSIARTGFLVNAAKYQPGTSRPEFNALLMSMTERVPSALVKNGGDYIAQMQRVLEGSPAKIELSGPTRVVNLDGVPFTVADAKMTVGMAVMAQRYYVTISKGYALVITYMYMDEADLKTFDEVLTTVKFK